MTFLAVLWYTQLQMKKLSKPKIFVPLICLTTSSADANIPTRRLGLRSK